MSDWIIKEWDGNDIKKEHKLSGRFSEKEIEAILQRLVCRNLTVAEILLASRRSNDTMRATFLDRVGSGKMINYGHSNLHYSAEKED